MASSTVMSILSKNINLSRAGAVHVRARTVGDVYDVRGINDAI
jgi:hypothetical protein